MPTLRVDPVSPDSGAIAQAASLLRAGQLVALPTETVYGLGADALNAVAVGRIFDAKGRPSYNPLIVHVFDVGSARALVTAWPDSAERLAIRFWPGPLTIVLPKIPQVPDLVTAGLETVALRVPRHPVMRAVLQAAAIPIAAPSANRSGQISPTTAAHVEQSLGDSVPLILDAGPTEIGVESTVIDVSGSTPILLRPGAVSREELSEVLRTGVAAADDFRSDTARPSPGMLDRHYAPRAVLRLLTAADMPRLSVLIGEASKTYSRVGVLTSSGEPTVGDVRIRLPHEPGGYAHGLYAALHEFDREGCDLIFAERPPERAEWTAILDRLDRAARP